MPCILKIRVIGARDLPVMDKATDLTDAYVEVRFADYEVQRTQICRKTLNPVWNADFRIEVSDDADLQNEPVELRVLDYDTISANDIVGLVSIDINPLLAWEASSTMEDSILNTSSASERQICGWFPLYDTLCGIRGEVNVQIKLQFFGDVNPFKDSSAGVCFFTSPSIPECYEVQNVYGLVEVILNEPDPEFSWADTFRAPRTSNESRQKLLYRLSGQLRRLLGRQVLEMNGNAVIGFKQYFDSESEGGILTGRAIGTSVLLKAKDTKSASEIKEVLSIHESEAGGLEKAFSSQSLSSNKDTTIESPTTKLSSSASMPQTDQSIESPQAGIDGDSVKIRESLNQNNMFQSPVDPVILTIHSLPSNVITNIGGIVSAKSVKLYQGNDIELRNSWWWELREEIMGHAKTLGCQYVMGYSETTAFRDELCVLSAIGTAVNIDISELTDNDVSSSYLANETITEEQSDVAEDETINNEIDDLADETKTFHSQSKRKLAPTYLKSTNANCRACHVPYADRNSPFPMTLTKCLLCGHGFVPEMLFTTSEIPRELDIVGEPLLLQAHVCRSKKKKEGESNAAIVSDSIPFIEYDLHRQLMYKLRVMGMNSLFGCQFQLTIGDGWMVAVASGTAAYIPALPSPPLLRINRNNFDVVADAEDQQRLLDLQKRIVSRSDQNHKIIEDQRLKYFSTLKRDENQTGVDNDLPAQHVRMEIMADQTAQVLNQQTMTTSIVVQVDDDSDEDLMAVLLDPQLPQNFILTNLGELCPVETIKRMTSSEPKNKKLFQQMITLIKEANLMQISGHPNAHLSLLFHELFQSIKSSFAVSNNITLLLQNVQVNIDMPKEGLIHMRVNAMLTGLYDFIESSRDDLQQESLSDQDEEDQDLSSDADGSESNSPSSNYYPNFDLESLAKRKSILPHPVIDMFPSTAANLPSTHEFVHLTALPRVSQARTIAYLGRLSLHFVKEDLNLHHAYGNHYTDFTNHTTDDVIDDDLGRFVHAFLVDIQAIVRAHTIAMGGNAVVGYRIENSEFRETVRNQAYGMVSVGGDVVRVLPECESLEVNQNLVIGSWDEFVNNEWNRSDEFNNKGR